MAASVVSPKNQGLLVVARVITYCIQLHLAILIVALSFLVFYCIRFQWQRDKEEQTVDALLLTEGIDPCEGRRWGPTWIPFTFRQHNSYTVTAVRVHSDWMESYEDLELLEALPSLDTLILIAASDTVVDALPISKKMRTLILDESALTHEGMRCLAEKYPRLESMRIEQGEVEEETVLAITGFRNLETLRLTEVGIAPNSLYCVQEMPKLRLITLERIDVDAGSVQELRARLPRVVITEAEFLP